MEIQYSELDNGIRQIKLIGTLDVLGVGQLKQNLQDIAQERSRVCWWIYLVWTSWRPSAFGFLPSMPNQLAAGAARWSC